jgi:hypothetical protein
MPGKFDGTHELRFKDNAKGGWVDRGAWYGTLVENAVQATARDLLAAAMLRIEAAAYPIVLTVHDEIVCEVPEGLGSVEEFHDLMVEVPGWATGFPAAARAWTRQRYAKGKAPTADPKPARMEPDPVPTAGPIDNDDAELKIRVPLTDLIARPLVGGKTICPFHDDQTPSLAIYDDHFHCYACGAHGDLIDWLMLVEGLDRREAKETLATWDGPVLERQAPDKEISRASVMRLWEAALPIVGTLAARYLANRGIDIAALPADIHETLRFHPRCPFGPGTRHPCLVALMREPVTDESCGIHRTALTTDAQKIGRRTLGTTGPVKIWKVGAQLVIGEGLETVLAAATRIAHRGAPLQPAWAATSTGPLSRLPVLPGVERLIILVDHDAEGRNAARICADRWSRAGRSVARLMPKRPGTDFNDMLMERPRE